MKGWGNLKNAAKYADVSKRTLTGWFKEGLKHSRLNHKTILIRYDDIDDFLEQYNVKDSLVDNVVDEIMNDFN